MKSVSLVFFVAALVFSVSFLLTQIFPDNIASYAVPILILTAFFFLNWLFEAKVTTPMRLWHPQWFLLATPFLALAFVNMFMGTDWSSLKFSTEALISLGFQNFGTGLFEETIMRVMALYLLIRVWGHTRKGLVAACLVQAVIFGLLHYSNFFLADAPFGAVTVQVIYATLFGIAFGALALLANTIWIGVVTHALVDALGSLNDYFGPNTAASDLPKTETFIYYLSQISIVFVFTIPFAIWALRKAPLYKPSEPLSNFSKD